MKNNDEMVVDVTIGNEVDCKLVMWLSLKQGFNLGTIDECEMPTNAVGIESKVW